MSFEKHCDFFCALVAGILWGINECFARPLLHVTQAVAAMLQLSSNLLGFQCIAFTVLVGLTGSRAVEQLKKAKKFDQLVGYFVSAIAWAFVVMTASFLAISFELPSQLPALVFHTLSAAMVVGSLTSSLRVLWLLKKILAR